MIARDPATGRETVLSSSLDPAVGPYDWAVCHAGSWIYRQHRYAWVAGTRGTRRHHRCPVRWIKTGRSLAYVPIHARDEKGKPPINRGHGVFAIHGKQGQSVERITLKSGSSIKLLSTPPKEFLSVSSPTLSRAGDPHVNAYRLAGTMVAAKSSGVREPGTSLTFDRRSQSFMVAKQVMQENKNAPELRAFNSRIGNTQTHASSSRGFGGGGGSHSSSGGSGTHSGGGGGGFHGSCSGGGGGGFHGSSGGSGGGGSHSRGGGVAEAEQAEAEATTKAFSKGVDRPSSRSFGDRSQPQQHASTLHQAGCTMPGRQPRGPAPGSKFFTPRHEFPFQASHVCAVGSAQRAALISSTTSACSKAMPVNTASSLPRKSNQPAPRLNHARRFRPE